MLCELHVSAASSASRRWHRRTVASNNIFNTLQDRSTDREGTFAEFSASSWYDKRRACGWPETLAVSRVGDGLNHVTDIDWTIYIYYWIVHKVQTNSTLTDTVYIGSSSGLVTSEVAVKQTCKRCERPCTLVLFANVKRHAGFPLVPKSVTLNDLERRNDLDARSLYGSRAHCFTC